MKIRNPIQDNHFLVAFLCWIRNYTESSHIEPSFAADTLYKIRLLTNQKAPFQELASHWSKVGFYKGCPQQNKALYENFQYNSWSQTQNLPGNICHVWGSDFSPTLLTKDNLWSSIRNWRHWLFYRTFLLPKIAWISRNIAIIDKFWTKIKMFLFLVFVTLLNHSKL